jgi:hypothetical protein
VSSYGPNEHPESIDGICLPAIDSALQNVLGNTNYDRSALFDTKIDMLLSGGQIIRTNGMMENLIIQLESLVKAWNRQEDTSTKKVFNDLTKDAVYFSRVTILAFIKGLKKKFFKPVTHAMER